MWISAGVQKMLNDASLEIKKLAAEHSAEYNNARRLEVENARLRADLDWFKLRLNAVEKERQMLMMDRIGVKIPVPEFVPADGGAMDELESVNQMPDLSMIGHDAPDGFDPAKSAGPDYSGLPQRMRN
jgi:hypothetical protein